MTELLFDGRRAYAHLRYLSLEIGDRLGGSENELEASAYVADHFRGLGLEVRCQEFPVLSYGLQEKRLEVLEPDLGEIPCEAFWLLGDTPPEGLEGDLLFLDSGAEEAIGPEVADKIVLVTGGVRGAAYERMMRFQPLAMVVVEARVAVPPMRVEALPEMREKFGAVPTVRITHEDGLRLVKQKVRRLRLVVRTEEIPATSQNVIGELPGSTFDDEIVLIGAHYDTAFGIQGASDNTGGAALVMELARVFAESGTRRTMCFVVWGSEELGLRGSVHYVKDLKARDKEQRQAEDFVKGRDRTELERHLLCVNLDVHGAVLGTNQARILGPADLTAAVRLLAKETGVAHEVEEEVYSSDGTPLSEAGVPSVSFSRSGGTTTYLHTVRDVIDYVGPEALELNGRFVELFLRRYVAGAALLPFERKIPDEQQKKVRDYFEKQLRIDYYDDEDKGA
ncbi:MAG: M20/M25/M40 family metallo-hydrolase [Chloroflexia bacterium]|nr:M20/M25/M40 family metallo-hydrolase [Chloroflexia bacterium]